MYDDLDDPNPPVPGPDQQAEVRRRAARIRRRRETAWIGGTAVAVALAVIFVSGGAPADDRLDTVGDPTASAAPATSEPEPPGGSPSASALPSPSPPADRSPTASADPPRSTAPATPTPSASEPVPTTSPTSPFHSGDEPDGKPGWHSWLVGCGHEPVPATSRSPSEWLTIELRLDATSRKAGAPFRGEIVITNLGVTPVTFEQRDDAKATLVDASDRSRAAVMSDDIFNSPEHTVQPGQSTSIDIEIATAECGDTSRDAQPPLPPGEYDAIAWFRWKSGGDESNWNTNRVRITVT